MKTKYPAINSMFMNKPLQQFKYIKGDVLIGLSTSGNSQNIVNALKQAKELGLTTIGFTGETEGKINQYCDVLIKVPSSDTPRIQEAHLMIGHAICELVEKKLFS